MRYVAQVVGWTLIWSGLFIFGYLGWQIYGTDWVNAGVQAEAAEDLSDSLSTAEPTVEEVDSGDVLEDDSPSSEMPQVVSFYPEDPAAIGEPFAFLNIPSLGIDGLVVYEGVDRETLKQGPGHMPQTPLPGQPGNTVISGHRTTHGRPFFDVDLLEPGDRIEVETVTGTHVYAVTETIVVDPSDVWVTSPRPGGWLTLTTCHPKFSARERMIVFAEIVSSPNLDYIELTQISLQE